MSGGSLRARSIGSTAAAILRASANGSVAATFSRSCYLQLDAGIIALVAPELLNGPLNIVVADRAGFSFEQLEAGQPVSVSSRTLGIGNRIFVEIAGARVWNAQLPPLAEDEANGLVEHLAAIDVVLAGAPEESLARPQRPGRAAEAMPVLAEGLRRADTGMVEDAAGRLAGLGPGLTPSGDDLLAGAMLALTLLPSPSRQRLRDAIRRMAAGRTTRVSAAYLEAASRGEAGQAWHGLRDALATSASAARDPGAFPAVLDAAARRVMAFGETSGADMLAGFVLGLRALSAP